MKVEKFSFAPNIAGNTLVLNDDTLQVKAITLTVTKTGSTVAQGSGHDDSIARGGQCVLGTPENSDRSSSYSIFIKKDVSGTATNAVRGKVGGAGFSNVGEIEFTFDTADSGYVVDGLAFGD